MKRIFLLMTILILLLCLSGCSNKDKQDFYGVYTFDKVSYLPSFSSSTIGFINEYFKGSKYTIETGLFKIETPDSTFEIKSPKYAKEEIPDDVNELSNVRSFIGNDEVEYQYTIYNNDGSKTYWRLYISSDCVWIASYQDNPANGSEIIINIYELSN
ncbi:hypothetical protein [Clostridium sp.]|uniref:hypothetical protein n=1 Tax=Clostridium sp. TaxID=1506 RepID=UPI003D6D61EF